MARVDDDNNYSPGSFGCHELLHITSVLSSMLEAEIIGHPACRANPEWTALAEEVARGLADLYQSIGANHLLAPEVHG